MPTWDALWTTGRTVYFVAFKDAATYFRNDSGAVETYSTAHLPLYSVPAAESQRKGIYTAAVPPTLPEGEWVVLAFENAGGIPQSTESEADSPAGSGNFQGSGTPPAAAGVAIVTG